MREELAHTKRQCVQYEDKLQFQAAKIQDLEQGLASLKAMMAYVCSRVEDGKPKLPSKVRSLPLLAERPADFLLLEQHSKRQATRGSKWRLSASCHALVSSEEAENPRGSCMKAAPARTLEPS